MLYAIHLNALNANQTLTTTLLTVPAVLDFTSLVENALSALQIVLLVKMILGAQSAIVVTICMKEPVQSVLHYALAVSMNQAAKTAKKTQEMTQIAVNAKLDFLKIVIMPVKNV